MKKTYLLLILSALIVLIAGCTQPAPEPAPTPAPPAPSPSPAPAPTPAPAPPPAPAPAPTPEEEYEIKTAPDGTKYIVHPNKIVGGGPPKDGIPSIDNPKFVPLEEAEEWIEDNELVLAIIYKGVKRVYPLQIMVWHEIVNDVIAGDPLLITY